MKEAIIATHNPGKVKEFKEILEPRGYEVKSLAEIGFTEEIEETGHTFEENAILKAEAVAKAVNKMVIADDSGLSVDNLGGRPGVYSARYAGEQKDDQANIDKVLSELKGIEKEQRTARFRCALAVSIPGEETKTVEGHVEGYIAEEPKGEYGFGYDPIFIVKDKDKTMAELTSDEKIKSATGLTHLKSCRSCWRHKGSVYMNVLIISDSHGLEEELQTIAKRHEADVDLMIHCGDSELETGHPALEPYSVVKGNCDFIGDFKDELLLTAGSKKYWLRMDTFMVLNRPC